jgi:hypothetical protein
MPSLRRISPEVPREWIYWFIEVIKKQFNMSLTPKDVAQILDGLVQEKIRIRIKASMPHNNSELYEAIRTTAHELAKEETKSIT